MSEEKKDVDALKAYLMEVGDIKVGISAEIPDRILLHIPRAEAALALSKEMAQDLHDFLCAALATIEGEGPREEEIPLDSKKWN